MNFGNAKLWSLINMCERVQLNPDWLKRIGWQKCVKFNPRGIMES